MCDSDSTFSERDAYFMKAALEQAELALTEGEVPVGCVVVRDGKIVGRGRNKTNETKNGTRHAEMIAIDAMLCDCDGDVAAVHFPSCVLYVTCEPCIMCAGALSLLHFQSVVFGCANDKFGGNGSIVPVNDDGCGRCGSDSSTVNGGVVPLGGVYPSHGGLCAGEAVKLLQDFYIAGNPNAPKPHRPVQMQA